MSKRPKPGAPAAQPASMAWIQGLLVVAILLSSYLLVVSVLGGGVAGCGSASPCDVVLRSPWSHWMGLPVSGLALLAYAGAFFVAWQTRREPLRWRDACLLCSVVIGGAALWFMALQVVVLRAICPYCTAAHAVGVVVAGLFFRHYRDTRRAPRAAKGRPPAMVMGVGLVALGLLVGGQFVFQPSGVAQVTLASNPAPGDASSPEARILELPEGQGRVPMAELPILGSRSATNVMFCLFDYSCSYCQRLHGMLLQQLPAFTNQLAVVLLPTPLSTNCNPSIPRTPPDHRDACEYAQIALAVWRARPDLFPAFDIWLFSTTKPPTPEAARREAEQRIGADVLAKALQDPWIGETIRRHGRLYAAIFQRHKQDLLPELVTPKRVTFGAFPRAQHLDRVLREAAGLPPEPAPAPPKSP